MDRSEEGFEAELAASMYRFLSTAISRPKPATEATLQQAEDRLARVDLVGVTEDLDGLVARLDSQLALRLPAPPRANRGTHVIASVSQAFRARLAEENALDQRLYERARTLAESE